MLVNRVAYSSKNAVLHLLWKQNKGQILHPMWSNVISKRIEAEDLQNTIHRRQQLRTIHVTKVNRDIEMGLRALGAGVAATGVIGPGIGVGIVFGNLVSSIARNPSVSKELMTPAFLGMSFCESLGIFAMVLGFMVQ